MDLKDTVKINTQILKLIESKHDDMPSLWPNSPETTYYKCLLADTALAISAIDHGGLAHHHPDQL